MGTSLPGFLNCFMIVGCVVVDAFPTAIIVCRIRMPKLPEGARTVVIEQQDVDRGPIMVTRLMIGPREERPGEHKQTLFAQEVELNKGVRVPHEALVVFA